MKWFPLPDSSYISEIRKKDLQFCTAELPITLKCSDYICEVPTPVKKWNSLFSSTMSVSGVTSTLSHKFLVSSSSNTPTPFQCHLFVTDKCTLSVCQNTKQFPYFSLKTCSNIPCIMWITYHFPLTINKIPQLSVTSWPLLIFLEPSLVLEWIFGLIFDLRPNSYLILQVRLMVYRHSKKNIQIRSKT